MIRFETIQALTFALALSIFSWLAITFVRWLWRVVINKKNTGIFSSPKRL